MQVCRVAQRTSLASVPRLKPHDDDAIWLSGLAGLAARALEDGRYVSIETSRVIAGLPIAEIAQRREDEAARAKSNALAFRREWQQWLREHKHLHDDTP